MPYTNRRSTVISVKEEYVPEIKKWLRETALNDDLPESVKEFALKAHQDLSR